MFGQCAYASPDLTKHNCPGKYQRFYFGTVGTGRSKKQGLIYLDEWRKCDCLCHVPEDERPKPKKTRRRRAK